MAHFLTRNSIDNRLKISLITTANKLADSAREAIMPLFRTNQLDTISKETLRFDPVTKADKLAELAMRKVLKKIRPEDGIIGEEFKNIEGKSGLTWVLDPIDGTRAFVSGTPTWGVLIALSDTEGPFLGIIDQPYISERFIGGLGKAFCTGPTGQTLLKTSIVNNLKDSTLFTTFPEIGDEKDYKGFRSVHDRVKLVRYGMDCYAYGLLAAGQIDLVIEANLQTYDIQAPIALIEASGGFVTNWLGTSAHSGGQVVAAANVELLNEVLPILKPFAD